MDEGWNAWLGREERTADRIDVSHARAIAAMLDESPDSVQEGTPLPPLWHWFYFRPLAPQSQLADDGHPHRGGFLPPVALPRRMWAGGRLCFPGFLRVEEEVERRSRILSVQEKEGRTGRLVVVTVQHEIAGVAGVAVSEEHDIVYREASRPASVVDPQPEEAPAADWQERFRTDPVLLFRFSALTFNGHRIHYDHPYATQDEGYPGLVIHGPLIALHLLRSAAGRTGRPPAAFAYRAVSPLFCGEEVVVAGRNRQGQSEVRALGPRGTAMRATVTWKPTRDGLR
jgi:3-methylfumaryl-CoA hydratase